MSLKLSEAALLRLIWLPGHQAMGLGQLSSSSGLSSGTQGCSWTQGHLRAFGKIR